MPTVPPAGRSAFAGKVIDDRLIGDALLSNTTVCEASRLLLSPTDDSNRGEKSSITFTGLDAPGAVRICDLMSLIDSAVLHDRIFSLPASLPDDVRELELRNRLVENGVLALLPKGDDHDLIGRALLASLSTVDGYFSLAGGRIETTPPPLSFEDIRPALMDELGLTSVTDQAMSDRPAGHGVRQRERLQQYRSEARRRSQGRYTRYGIFDTGANAKSFDEAAQALIGWMDYAGSGAYESSAASLRAMYYVFASEHYGLPYLASASVQAVQRRFPNYFQPSVREKLYEQLASALGATVLAVAQEFDGPIIFVPPFSALVLNRASTPDEIPSETLALRAEYSDFREKMRELERDRLEARSLNDRLKALRRIERLGKEVVRPFDQVSQMKLDLALRYIPDAAEVATNPTNPAGWARVLLGLPATALVNWYRRRPVAKLVRVARAVGELADYDSLLAKHFGENLASVALQIQSSLQAS